MTAVDAKQVRRLPSLTQLSSALQEKGKLSVEPTASLDNVALSPTKNIGRLQMPTRSTMPAAPGLARSFTTNSIPTVTRRGSVPSLAAIEQRFAKQETIPELAPLPKEHLALPNAPPMMQRSKSGGAEPSNKGPLPEKHPLQYAWTFYADTKQANGRPPPSPMKPKSKSGEAYSANMACIGKIKTVEAFARLFNHMKKPTGLADKANLMCFKDDIAPMWEDPANENGGKWTVAFNGSCSNQIDHAWLDLMLALVGGYLDEREIVTGIVANIRLRGNRIQIWIRDKTQIEHINALGRSICSALGNLTDGQGIGLDFSAHSGGANSLAGNHFLRVMPSHAASQPLLSRSNSVPNMLRPGEGQQKPLGFSAFMPPISPTKRKATDIIRRGDRSNIENVAPAVRD